jgi:hypothetical protein
MKKVLYIMIASSIAFYAGQASASAQKDQSDCKMKFTKEEKRNNDTNRGIAKASSKTRAAEAFRRKSS